MNLGQKLYDLRKSKHLSQEEVADKLNVTRQTISKWETDQSTPDFDKIIPLCELYGVSADELLRGKKCEKGKNIEDQEDVSQSEKKKKKRALGIGIGVFLYFISIAWVSIAIPVFFINPILASGIFLILCGVATSIIIYSCIVYKDKKAKKEEKQSKLEKQITEVVALITLIIYLMISFLTMAWHLTWIIWIIYALVEEIIKLVFLLRGNENEK